MQRETGPAAAPQPTAGAAHLGNLTLSHWPDAALFYFLLQIKMHALIASAVAAS